MSTELLSFQNIFDTVFEDFYDYYNDNGITAISSNRPNGIQDGAGTGDGGAGGVGAGNGGINDVDGGVYDGNGTGDADGGVDGGIDGGVVGGDGGSAEGGDSETTDGEGDINDIGTDDTETAQKAKVRV